MRKAVFGLTIFYSIAAAALSLGWALWPQATWWLALTNVFALYTFVPLLLFIPLAILLRDRSIGLLLSIPLAAFLALFGKGLLPPHPAQTQGTHLRVLTINQLFTNKQPAVVIDAIETQNADIVAIQELSIRVAFSAAQLHERYPYQYM